jgi:uncharacterized protein (DUF1697 family)
MTAGRYKVRYVALLRGINVGGKNKVAMKDLAACFEKLGHASVSTYINSGNVFFESPETDETDLVSNIETAIEKQFGFPVLVAVISKPDLLRAVRDAPIWWGKEDGGKHNAIFVIAPATATQVMQEVGDAKPEYEKVAASGPIIFWSTTFKDFNKTQYSKMVGTPAYKKVTIRNANTTRKLVDLLGSA